MKKINIIDNIFQISAIKLYLPNKKGITLCDLHNQPSQNYDLSQLPNILSQFQDPVLIMGDFNAHHPLWDINITDADQAGEKIEQFITNKDYCCLNEDDAHTYMSKTHRSFSSIDLTLCSTNLVEYVEWYVLNDNYTTDHYPIVLSYLLETTQFFIPIFNFNKADWKYDSLTSDISPFQHSTEHNDINSYLTNFIVDAANKFIPKTSCNSNIRSVP